ncbi:hypothetical protein T4A_1777 [Trichinella pseudospiralis]|uniref:Secreted protein n=1 Tax=Trichinella pseudospiralis TaxID=6337 RepID=A0A0V1EC03_TRIPS|nr:hypothetical protein T4A_1777 [Trichinella pseudospiralis]
MLNLLHKFICILTGSLALEMCQRCFHQSKQKNSSHICLANGDATMGVAAELAFFSTDCLINSATCKWWLSLSECFIIENAERRPTERASFHASFKLWHWFCRVNFSSLLPLPCETPRVLGELVHQGLDALRSTISVHSGG